MINVYGFYSCGGYKDMYLGNSDDADNPKYYLPLLPVMKNRNNPDEKEKIEKLKKLPMIQIITRDDRHGFPKECDILFSHGAYTVIYKTLSNGNTCLSIKDIPGIDKDEMGREIPFNLMFIATNEESKKLLDNFALYVKDNYSECIELCNILFKYDYLSNGIKFDLPAIITKIKDVHNNVRLTHKNNQLVYLMLYSEKNIEIAFKEQNLSFLDTPCIINTKGEIIKGKLPIEDSESEKEENKETEDIFLKNEDLKNEQVKETEKELIIDSTEEDSSNDRYVKNKNSIIENLLEKKSNEIIAEINKLSNRSEEKYLSIKEEIEKIKNANGNNIETNSTHVEWIEKILQYKDIYYILASLLIIILLLF